MSTTSERLAPSVSSWLRFVGWLGRVWRKLIDAFSPPDPPPVASTAPPPAPPGRLSIRRRVKTLTVPAHGYIFNFQVNAVMIWSSDGLTHEQLNRYVDALTPYAMRRLYAVAASYSRQHQPHRAREFELELQEEVKNQGKWKYTWQGSPLVCRPHVWVGLEDHVKEAVRPYWEQLIKLDCDHDVQMRRAEYAERLSKHWTTILTGLMDSPVADGAAEMTEKELAEVVRKIVAEQKAAADKLEDLMRKKVEDGDNFERSDHFDALKERLERRADRRFQQASANGQKPPAA